MRLISSPFYTSQKVQLHNGAARPPACKNPQCLSAQQSSVGCHTPCRKDTPGATHPQLCCCFSWPTLESAWKPQFCPYHHGKKKTLQKANQNNNYKHPALFRNDLALLFSQHSNVLTVPSWVTAILASNERHCGVLSPGQLFCATCDFHFMSLARVSLPFFYLNCRRE